METIINNHYDLIDIAENYIEYCNNNQDKANRDKYCAAWEFLISYSRDAEIKLYELFNLKY